MWAHLGTTGTRAVTRSAHHLDTMWQVPSARITHTLHVLGPRIGPCPVLSRIAFPQIAARAVPGPSGRLCADSRTYQYIHLARFLAVSQFTVEIVSILCE